MLNVSVCMLPELAMLAMLGVTLSGLGPVIVNVAATVAPVWSLAVNNTFVSAVTTPAGTVTVNVPPLALTVPVDGWNARVSETTV